MQKESIRRSLSLAGENVRTIVSAMQNPEAKLLALFFSGEKKSNVQALAHDIFFK